MDFRSKTLAAVVAVSFMIPFFIPEDSEARSSRRRNQAAEWEQERRQEEREERHDKRLERYYKHKERQLDGVLDTVGGRGRSGGTSRGHNPPGNCMYGVNGEVIHRPAGAVCKGDKPAPAAQAPASATQATKKETKGRCVYGKSGKLLWSEPGAEC